MERLVVPIFLTARIGVVIWMIAMSSLVAAAQTVKFEPFRINCGGPRYVDPDTKLVWKADSLKYVTKSYQMSKCNNRHVAIANTTSSMRQYIALIDSSNQVLTYNQVIIPSQFLIRRHRTSSAYILLRWYVREL